MPAKRVIITIPDEDKLWLDAYTKVNKISLAEAVCQGVNQLKQGQRQKTYQRLVESTYGIWRKGNGLAHQQKMRVAWE